MNNGAMKIYDVIKEQDDFSMDGMKPVMDALKVLNGSKRSAIAITIRGQFAGIFSYADFVRRVMMKGRNPKRTVLLEVATMDPFTISPECTVLEAFDLMTKRGYSHLPVVSSDKCFLGIISHDDLRQKISKSIKDTMAEAGYLMAYVSGESYGGGSQGSESVPPAVWEARFKL